MTTEQTLALESRSERPLWLAEICLVLALAAAVCSFGAVTASLFLPVGTFIVVLAAAVLWRYGWPRCGAASNAILAVLVGVPLLQLLPLPAALVRLVSPVRARVQSQLLDDLVSASWLPLTLNVHATQLAALRFLCYAAVFVLAFRLRTANRRSPVLVYGLFIIGTGEALYGLFQYVAGSPFIFDYRNRFFGGRATGTYINPNHFTGLLEMIIPFLAAAMIGRLAVITGNWRKSWTVALKDTGGSSVLLHLALLAIIATGMLFSISRAALLMLVIGIVVPVRLLVWNARRSLAASMVLAVLALPVAYALYIGPQQILNRFPSGFGRGEVTGDTLKIVRDYPVFGTGAGTYFRASLHYQTTLLDWRYEHAHNDYLEIVSELGLPAGLLIIGGLLWLVARTAHLAARNPQAEGRTMAAGCAGAMICILVHGLVDFNLQIPANAMLFSLICGLAAATVSARAPIARPILVRPLSKAAGRGAQQPAARQQSVP